MRDVRDQMTFTTCETAQNVLIGTIGLGAIFALTPATAGPSGWP
jgi:hypothetical protein